MQLGIVLAPYGQIPNSFPYGIGYSYGGDGTFMCPDDDALYQTRGEMGFYHDTQLGTPMPESIIIGGGRTSLRGMFSRWRKRNAIRKLGLGSSIPSDMQYGQVYGYVPQMSGWIASNQGNVQSPWIPPNGYRPGPLGCAGCAGPQLRGLGDVSPDTQAVLSAMQLQNNKMFTLSLLTAVAVGVSAVVAVIRNAKAIKHAVL